MRKPAASNALLAVQTLLATLFRRSILPGLAILGCASPPAARARPPRPPTRATAVERPSYVTAPTSRLARQMRPHLGAELSDEFVDHAYCHRA